MPCDLEVVLGVVLHRFREVIGPSRQITLNEDQGHRLSNQRRMKKPLGLPTFILLSWHVLLVECQGLPTFILLSCHVLLVECQGLPTFILLPDHNPIERGST